MNSRNIPSVAIVGRPNVGKSTLFNRLTGDRRALVHGLPGMTRDRLKRRFELRPGRWCEIVDTGGLDPLGEDEIVRKIREQAVLAINEAAVLVWVVDGREGITPADEGIAASLRRYRAPVIVTVNKGDTRRARETFTEFFRFGFENVVLVSAEHDENLSELIDRLVELLPETSAGGEEEPEEVAVAIVGRPNVGKSSLLNRLVGEDRMMVSDIPGTTRDSVDTVVDVGGRRYRFIDTAGIRKKGKTHAPPEVLSILAARRNLAQAQVALLVLDASAGVSSQDAVVAGYVVEAARAAIIVVNKWDLAEGKDTRSADVFTRTVRDRLKHLDYAPVLFVSARTGQRITKLYPLANQVAASYGKRLATPVLTRFLQGAAARHHAPVRQSHPWKLYYATQVGVCPPAFALFTNSTRAPAVSYQRYLENAIRSEFGFEGAPLRFLFRGRRPKSGQ